MPMNKENHKAGFINIIGNPNVGKSTLMNALVGEKVSIITSKAQTTRHRIMGIVNGEDYQLVYSDTPGIIKPNYKLQDSMMKSVKSALIDADVILYVTDVFEKPDKNLDYIEKIKKVNIPVIVVINKIDKDKKGNLESLQGQWRVLLPKADVIAVSALKKMNLENLLSNILLHIPDCPPYFPKDELTDKPTRFFVSEIIREKILRNYQQEIPYSVEIAVESFKELEKIINIQATIYCGRDSQKGIIIGKGGSALKKVGTTARLDMEDFLGKKVFLELFVKVKKNWREDDRFLKQFGY